MNERDYGGEWGDLQEFLESYQQETVDQIEWLPETDPEIQFKFESVLGDAVFQTHYRQLKDVKPETSFIDGVNQNLEPWFEERPVQLSNLTTSNGELAWLPRGKGSPYILEDEFESYDHDLIIYRPKDKPAGGETQVTGVKDARQLGSIPQEAPLNGLIKGLEEIE